MNRNFCLSSLLLAGIGAQAQQPREISAETEGEPVAVAAVGPPMGSPASSRFIAHLEQGPCRIQAVDADETDRHSSSRPLPYDDKIEYRGHGVRKIRIGGEGGGDGADRDVPPMRSGLDQALFKDFCKQLRLQGVDGRRERLIGILPASTRLTSLLCKGIIETLCFDGDGTRTLEKLYPRVADPEAFFKAVDAPTFSDYQGEVSEFARRYHLRHR